MSFDSWLKADGPVVFVAHIPMRSVSGPDNPVFPPSYPKPKKPPKGEEPSMYSMVAWKDGKFCCDIDSLGSQANRMEETFKDRYRNLVPQHTITAKTRIGSTSVNLLDLGHRIADGYLRCTDFTEEAEKTMLAYRRGFADELARVAPTSIVFGFWDSRGTATKAERLVQSSIRAYDVVENRRSAQFFPLGNCYDDDIIREELFGKLTTNVGQDIGVLDVPSTDRLGGVFVHGQICREIIVHLELVRRLRSADGNHRDLQAYILGLALVAAASPQSPYLRQGCTLLPDRNNHRVQEVLHINGSADDYDLIGDLDSVIDFATAAAEKFGVSEPINSNADKKAAERWLKQKKEQKAKKEKKSTS